MRPGPFNRRPAGRPFPLRSGVGGMGGMGQVLNRPSSLPARQPSECLPPSFVPQPDPAPEEAPELAPGECCPVELDVDNVRHVSRRTIGYTHPSPLLAPPYRGVHDPQFARAVLAPPTTPGSADGATAATNLAAAIGAISGSSPSVLTPATVTAWVDVLTFTVPSGRRWVLSEIGVWGHDGEALADTVRWRLRVGGETVYQVDSLARVAELLGDALVQAVATESLPVVVQAQHKDTQAPTLVEVALDGWSYPGPQRGDSFEDNLESAADPQAGGREGM